MTTPLTISEQVELDLAHACGWQPEAPTEPPTSHPPEVLLSSSNYLFLVSQDENSDYDTYDSFVCVAPSEEFARDLHPNGRRMNWEDSTRWAVWASTRSRVQVTLIGVAEASLEAGSVICASFNAG